MASQVLSAQHAAGSGMGGTRPAANGPSRVLATPNTAKVTRQRKSNPKVKTGCTPCKQKRVKCDELKPECSRCVKAKTKCVGYPPPSRSARPGEELPLLPRPLALSLAPALGLAPAAVANNGLAPAALPRAALPRTTIQLPPRRAPRQRTFTPPETPILQRALAQSAGHSGSQSGGSEHAWPVVNLYGPSLSLPFTEQEGLYFQLFREQTSNELSGFFDSVFWSRTVLQECQFEPAARHAVVALGALYKTLEKSTESPPGSPAPGEVQMPQDPHEVQVRRHWAMAISQYHDALRALATTTSQRTCLMGSVLLACFDSFIGHHKQAILHIQMGLGLLEQLRAERRRAFLPRPEEPVEEELIQMFTRLAIQAKSYDMAFHFPDPYVIRLTTPAATATPTSQNNTATAASSSSPVAPDTTPSTPVSLHAHEPIPDRFTSLIEARLAWDTLCEVTFRYTETMFSLAQSKSTGLLPSSLEQHSQGFTRQIEAWSDAFQPILESRFAPAVSSQEKAGIAVLKMFQIMGQILFSMTYKDSEMRFDGFTPRFRDIVDLALEVVGDEERRWVARRCPNYPNACRHKTTTDIFGGYEYTTRHIKPSFSADLGIVPPLFVVATKCRDPCIRRQAIQLLRSSSRREGMWDSELTARIGLWIAQVEEEEEGGNDYDNHDHQHSYHWQHNSHHNKMPTPSPAPDEMDPSAGPFSFSSSSPSLLSPAAFKYRIPSANTDFGSTQLGSSPAGSSGIRRNTATAAAVVVPEERRVMVRAVEFDLRERRATIRLGTRGLTLATPDMKTRVQEIRW